MVDARGSLTHKEPHASSRTILGIRLFQLVSDDMSRPTA